MMASAKRDKAKEGHIKIRMLTSAADAVGRAWAKGRVYDAGTEVAQELIGAGMAEAVKTPEQEAAGVLAEAGCKQVTVPDGPLAEAIAAAKIKVKTP